MVEGFESPFGLELLATVHWVIDEIGSSIPEDVIRATYAWSDRKRQFSERQITLVRDTLRQRGWLEPARELPA